MNVRDWEGFSSSPGSLMEIIFSSLATCTPCSYLLVNGQARLTHSWNTEFYHSWNRNIVPHSPASWGALTS